MYVCKVRCLPDKSAIVFSIWKWVCEMDTAIIGARDANAATEFEFVEQVANLEHTECGNIDLFIL